MASTNDDHARRAFEKGSEMPRGVAFLACTDEAVHLKASAGELEAHAETKSTPVVHAQKTGAVSPRHALEARHVPLSSPMTIESPATQSGALDSILIAKQLEQNRIYKEKLGTQF